ncbi:BolA family transcriptional regulator [Acinetobacter apis]|uniref:BolA protein n=1 Tax=Acinetobacter apis TaxID=1229165 RepID=A0A217EH70_9GAMM|nr:BolA family protein [Acinetobacter apis]SNQ29526.1 BolA protein [Acinetobacter apis]
MSLQQQLIENLNSLSPSHLEVINESSGHGGYYPGKESHFKVVIVSEAFEGLRAVQRHQKVYACTQNLLSAGGGHIHALALHTYVPSEWVGRVPESPNCAHAPKG